MKNILIVTLILGLIVEQEEPQPLKVDEQLLRCNHACYRTLEEEHIQCRLKQDKDACDVWFDCSMNCQRAYNKRAGFDQNK